MAYPVTQADPTAVIGRRTLAWFIDGLLVLVPVIALITSQFEYLSTEGLAIGGQPVTGEEFCDAFLDQNGGACVDAEEVNERVYFTEDGAGGEPNLLWLGLSLGLLVILQGLTGWTPGKLLTGLRTVREDGRPPGILKALLRWLLWIVDGFPYFIPGLVGFILGLTTTGHRRLGDMVAKTFVVRSADAGSPVVVPGLTAAPAPPVAGGWGAPPPGAPGAAPTGWGPAVDPSSSGWGSPTQSTPPAPPPTPQPAQPAPPADGPQWDEARGTYIQWDPSQGAWMQWDEATRAWSRMPGQ